MALGPSAPTKSTRAPARAAATAWLPPLPPGASITDDDSAVSPGRGMEPTTNGVSAFTRPTTLTRAIAPTLAARSGKLDSISGSSSASSLCTQSPIS